MILITGCAGFIGFHVARFYLEKGIKIIGIRYIDPDDVTSGIKI